MKLLAKAPEQATVSYRNPPASGNAINGLGEKDFRRASYVFHSNVKSGPLPFDKMQEVFRYSYPARMLPMIMQAAWATFRPQGKLSSAAGSGCTGRYRCGRCLYDLPGLQQSLSSRCNIFR